MKGRFDFGSAEASRISSVRLLFEAGRRVGVNASVFEDDFDGLIYANYFEPKAMINFKMKDNREFRFCDHCKVMKLPRMHHCSACQACCLKYDHHCGMLMNCIGVNNYHLFLQFMIVVALYMTFCFYLNMKYNFYLDYYL